MKIVVAENDASVVAERANEAQGAEGVGSPIHEIADEPDFIAIASKIGLRQQLAQFGQTALHITDGDSRHRQ
jgi:hypothetical protein